MNEEQIKIIQKKVKEFLEEDIDYRDVTTEEFIPSNKTIEAEIFVKKNCCLSGLKIAEEAFLCLDDQMEFIHHHADGAEIDVGLVVSMRGNAWAVLKGERTALNLLSRLSGIATLTKQYVNLIKGTNAEIYDTRKTTPGLRIMEKMAVLHGGGKNHRFGLFDMVLIKDNHLQLLSEYTLDAFKYMIDSLKHKHPKMLIEIEVDKVEQINKVIELGCDLILLDNMTIDQMKQCVDIIGNKAQIEASGEITLENVLEVAQTGVDRISIGALTHSVQNIGFSLEIVD